MARISDLPNVVTLDPDNDILAVSQAGGDERAIAISDLPFLSNTDASVAIDQQYQTLSAGQLVVTTQVSAINGIFYVSDSVEGGLSRKLTKITDDTPNGDYTATSNTSITLVRSFPQGTLLSEVGNRNDNPVKISNMKARPLEVIAHRGYREAYFQNTLLALSAAANTGVSIEMDAAISSDGVWYLFHDTAVDALTNGAGNFITLSSSTIDTLRYTEADGTRYEGIGITKLEDALKVIKRTGVKAYIEIKMVRNRTTDIDSFLSLIDQYDIASQVNISSFVVEDLQRIQINDNQYHTGLLVNTSDSTTAIIQANSVSANAVINSYTSTNSAFVNAIFEAGLDLIVYTADTKDVWDSMIDIGVRKIMTDKSTYTV